MKLASDYFNFTIDFIDKQVATLIIEAPNTLYSFLNSIYVQCEGKEGHLTLSDDKKILEISKHVELLSDFIGFSVNKKNLITKIVSTLNAEALGCDRYAETMRLLQYIESYIYDIQIRFDCNIDISKLSFEGILKAAGIALEDTYENDLEKVIDYFGLVREFDKEKLFILYNMRSIFTYENLSNFVETIVQKEYKVLLIDSHDYPLLPYEKRYVVDEDLCEIY